MKKYIMTNLIMKLWPERRSFNDQEIKTALQPTMKRLQRQHFMVSFLRGLAVAMLAALLLLAYSFLRPWADVTFYCLVVAGITILVTVVLAVISRPGLWEAACQVDAKGLKERVSTALELSNSISDNPMQRLQREDALKQLCAVDVSANFPLLLPRREGKILLVLTGFLLLLNVIPNPWQGEVDRQMAVRQEIAQQQKQVEKVKKELEKKNEKAPSARREEGIKALEDLQQKLAEAKKQEEAMKSMATTEEQLHKIASGKQDHVNSDLERLSQVLKQEEISRELGEKLATGNSREVEPSFAKMAEKIPALSIADQQKLAASLNKSSMAVSDGGLKNQLSQVAKTLNSGAAREAGGQLQSLGTTLGAMSSQAAVNSDLARAQLALQSSRMAIAAVGNSGNNGNIAATGTACQNPECNTP
ncbi:MAG: hypothetical protein PHW39_07845, partial [Syntrophomonadaceae bacterium]|nr:hypothetical protein [Syntrophomonadaceae bacterium]